MKAMERRVCLRSIDPIGLEKQPTLQALQKGGKAMHFMCDKRQGLQDGIPWSGGGYQVYF